MTIHTQLGTRTEVSDGMRIDWDVPIEVDDGLVLRADVFRPIDAEQSPVILSYGPYAKGLSFIEGYPSAWEKMANEHPDAVAGSTNKYQNWEVVDPEKWVPDGYACVRVDSRGCGRSPGHVDHFSERESRDLYACIEWAGTRQWSNGRVGLNGISYYAMNQWLVASLRPPHLAAICPWEGASDWYRDATHHGGIVSTFWANWYDMQVKTVQHGAGQDLRNPSTGQSVRGDQTLDEEMLAQNRTDFGTEILSHPRDDAYHRRRSPVWEKVTVPLLSAGNWGGQGLHLRGNIEGYQRAASPQKWLEVHGGEHWSPFYTDYGVGLQKRFFDHFLKGTENGWSDQPPVQLQIRQVDGSFTQRAEDAWPIPRTVWTHEYLDASTMTLTPQPIAPSSASFPATGEGLTFRTPPLSNEREVTGPLAARLFIASTTSDADLFLVVRAFAPNDEEVVFQGAIDPHTPVAQGWLRASHREIDPELSQPHRPYHTHTSPSPLVPGQVYQLDIEIWPTCVVLPTGYRIALTVRGNDYVHRGSGGEHEHLSHFKNDLTGCGPFLHDDPRDRPPDPFAGTTTVHTGGEHASYLLLPVVPPA